MGLNARSLVIDQASEMGFKNVVKHCRLIKNVGKQDLESSEHFDKRF
jgi:hypothetical protein